MKVNSILKSENGDIFETVKSFFTKLFEEGVIDYLLVPQRISEGKTLTQTLIKGVDYLDGVNPFSPVMAINSAKLASQVGIAETDKKVGVVLKPCEIRALIELVKLNQAKLDNLVIIGIDCAGTFEIEQWAKLVEESGDAIAKETEVLKDIYAGKTDYAEEDAPIRLRSACQICDRFTHDKADITLSILGMEDDVLVKLEDELAAKLGLEAAEAPSSHKDVLEDMKNARTYKRESAFDEFRDKMQSMNDMADILATCTRCYACQTACPICYCRVCFFRTETFSPEPARILRWADKEGALRMPTEILLYHLTRLNHVAASCVGCGMCESSCARGIPLSILFQSVGNEVQKKLEYIPGMNIDEELPVATFKQEETI
ncbi:MAG: Coenzyme F420 hydrogenase/dehydrogenase, beta subunit C-terminal domain [Deltaproteobacteria bacterium]|nr:Coenzyme F420 hydrogenase/dehydrogenase, beta subunit C-terminal domain [Deltaproteobacteria bacterium]